MAQAKKVKIGLALSGGGAKGGAHLGILKVLRDENIEISRMVGVSSGSIIGAAYCLGMPIEKIIGLADFFKKFKLFALTNINFFGDSLVKGKKIEKFLKKTFGNKTFRDCKIPFEVVCVDLESGTEVLINEGPLWQALMASSAIPGLFSAHFINSRYLADGGILNNIPVNHVRRHEDIDLVIGIDPGFNTNRQHLAGMIWEKYYKKPKSFNLERGFLHQMKLNYSLMFTNIFRAIDLTRIESQLCRIDEAKPDIIICPKTERISSLEFNKYEMVIEAGETAAREILPLLHERISAIQSGNE